MLSQLELTLALAAVILLTSGFLMWRGTARRHRHSRSNALEENRRERTRKEQSPEGLIQEMEVRLFDYGREVEGRVETTLTLLDRLILDAESEIDRLEDLLGQSKPSLRRTLDMSDRQRVSQLRSAGLSDEEIARCLQCDISAIENGDLHNGDDRKAA